MVSLNWVTFLSILVSGTMVFTLGATIVIYIKYKLGQKPVLQIHQEQVAMAGGPTMSITEAIQIFNDSKFQTSEVSLSKKKVRFSRNLIDNEVG